MGRKTFKLQNTLESPVTDDALMQALLAFVNGSEIVIAEEIPLSQTEPAETAEISRWSPWGDAAAHPEERLLCATALQRIVDDAEFSWPRALFSESLKIKYGNYELLIPSREAIDAELRRRVAVDKLRDPTGAYKQSYKLAVLIELILSVKFEPRLSLTSNGFSLIIFRRFGSIGAALMHAMICLSDQRNSHSRALCRCKLPGCGKFYLARKNPKGGPANRTYCSPEHRDEHHNSAERKAADAARRMRAKHK